MRRLIEPFNLSYCPITSHNLCWKVSIVSRSSQVPYSTPRSGTSSLTVWTNLGLGRYQEATSQNTKDKRFRNGCVTSRLLGRFSWTSVISYEFLVLLCRARRCPEWSSGTLLVDIVNTSIGFKLISNTSDYSNNSNCSKLIRVIIVSLSRRLDCLKLPP